MPRKPAKEPGKNLGLRLPLPIHAALVKSATKNRRSLKSEALTLLEKALGLAE